MNQQSQSRVAERSKAAGGENFRPRGSAPAKLLQAQSPQVQSTQSQSTEKDDWADNDLINVPAVKDSVATVYEPVGRYRGRGSTPEKPALARPGQRLPTQERSMEDDDWADDHIDIAPAIEDYVSRAHEVSEEPVPINKYDAPDVLPIRYHIGRDPEKDTPIAPRGSTGPRIRRIEKDFPLQAGPPGGVVNFGVPRSIHRNRRGENHLKLDYVRSQGQHRRQADSGMERSQTAERETRKLKVNGSTSTFDPNTVPSLVAVDDVPPKEESSLSRNRLKPRQSVGPAKSANTVSEDDEWKDEDDGWKDEDDGWKDDQYSLEFDMAARDASPDKADKGDVQDNSVQKEQNTTLSKDHQNVRSSTRGAILEPASVANNLPDAYPRVTRVTLKDPDNMRSSPRFPSNTSMSHDPSEEEDEWPDDESQEIDPSMMETSPDEPGLANSQSPPAGLARYVQDKRPVQLVRHTGQAPTMDTRTVSERTNYRPPSWTRDFPDVDAKSALENQMNDNTSTEKQPASGSGLPFSSYQGRSMNILREPGSISRTNETDGPQSDVEANLFCADCEMPFHKTLGACSRCGSWKAPLQKSELEDPSLNWEHLKRRAPHVARRSSPSVAKKFDLPHLSQDRDSFRQEFSSKKLFVPLTATPNAYDREAPNGAGPAASHDIHQQAWKIYRKPVEHVISKGALRHDRRRGARTVLLTNRPSDVPEQESSHKRDPTAAALVAEDSIGEGSRAEGSTDIDGEAVRESTQANLSADLFEGFEEPEEPIETSAQSRKSRRPAFEDDEFSSAQSQRRTPRKLNGSRAQDGEDFDDEEDQPRRKKKGKKESRSVKEAQAAPTPIYLPDYISIGNLATALRVRLEDFTRKMEDLGFEETNNDYILDAETAGLIAVEFNYEPYLDTGETQDLVAQPVPEDVSLLPQRPPVITIMGHVDHGKTTLLDHLRKSSVAASEFGGITQHIGAFTVSMPSGRLFTFLDTPGHAAFLSMRERGANVTDIVVLVVAADDSVKPQTLEAIKHAKAANVPMIVAINKVDKPAADIERVKQDLARHSVDVEDYGGDTQVVCVSGKTGEGMDQLEENLGALADVIDMRADPEDVAEGWVIEASLKKSGRVATVLVRRGTVRPGSIIVAGTTWAKVRVLRNDVGVEIPFAGPGTPAEIDGWREQPEAGDEVLEAPDEQKAKSVVDYRLEQKEQARLAGDVQAVNETRRAEQQKREAFKEQLEAAEGQIERDKREEALKALTSDSGDTSSASATGLASASRRLQIPVIIKADVSGSAEALSDSLSALGNAEVGTRILSAAVGAVSTSDIELAGTSKGIIIAFNTSVEGNARWMADTMDVNVLEGNIIYRIIDEVKSRLEEHLPPRISTRVTGEGEVAALFDIKAKKRKIIPVAGTKVKNGVLARGKKVRGMRGGQQIWAGEFD